MAFRFIFVALIAFMVGLTILQQSLWGNMGPRKSAIVTFVGLVFLSAAIVLGTLGYLGLNLRGEEPDFAIALLGMVLLGLCTLGAMGIYIQRRSIQGAQQTTLSHTARWIDSDRDIPDG
jgi:hypothetical protein